MANYKKTHVMHYQCDSVTGGRCHKTLSDILLNKVIIGDHFHSIISFVIENNISNQTNEENFENSEKNSMLWSFELKG